jgi:DNA-directed RNA polymerase specialized sigma24 family protein
LRGPPLSRISALGLQTPSGLDGSEKPGNFLCYNPFRELQLAIVEGACAMNVTHALAPHLPYLRRYARALTGSQQSGDAYVRAALTALLSGEHVLDANKPPRVALYRLFHQIWSSPAEHYDTSDAAADSSGNPEGRLLALSASRRAALLLTAVESFSLDEAGAILGEEPEEVERAVIEAQRAIETELISRVLIIEDELGHEVVGTAATRDQAVKLAHSTRPGLVLADINLGEGGSGIDAVSEILDSFDIPVIFVTAYPEKLLTGERPEPTYLIAKPFLPETVQATVGQALFFHPIKRKAA